MPELGAAVRAAPHSGIRAIARKAAAIPGALPLHAGDPNFVTPGHIIDAACADAHAGYTKYTPSAGLPTLREAIADKVTTLNGIEASVENVVVTTGGCGAIFTSLLALIEPGDEVLIPDPGWANNASIVVGARGIPVPYALDAATGFLPDPDALAASVSTRTRVIIVNSPANPSGRVYEPETLRLMLEFAERHDLWLLSDECYDALTFDRPHVSVATLGGHDRVVSVFSFSKTYAMTGWRVGYAVASPEVADAVAWQQVPPVGNAPAPSQRAAEAALLGPQACVDEMRAAYRERRDAATAQLDAAGLGYVKPEGAFYVMVDIARPGERDVETCERLLEEHHVAVVPGSAFGAAGAGFARVALCVEPSVVEEGLGRIAAFMHDARSTSSRAR